MLEEKESFWRKKGFYLAVCTALVCLLAIGTVYYKMNYQADKGGNLFADSVTSAPGATSGTTGGSAIGESGNGTTGKTGKGTDVAAVQKNTNKSGKSEENSSTDKTQKTEGTEPGAKDSQGKETDVADNNTVNIAEKNTDDRTQSKAEKSAGSGTQNKAGKNTEVKAGKGTDGSNGKNMGNALDDGNAVATMSETGSKNKFDLEKGLLWPVSGDVILKYSMGNTVYFKTLAQYKCNPAIVISSKEGTKVKSAADGTVTKVTKSDETGNMVTVDIGSGYSVTYGQLEDISVKEGQAVKESDVIGKIARPTKYYSQEGSNLYLQVMENDKPVDPLLLLR